MEGLVTGRDGIIRGAKLIVITNWKPVHISRPVHKLYLLEVGSEGEGLRTTGVFVIEVWENPQGISLVEMQYWMLGGNRN